MIWFLLVCIYLIVGEVALRRSGTDRRLYPGEAALIAFGWLPLLVVFGWMLVRGRA